MGALGVLLPNVLRSPDPARATCLSAPQAEHEEPTGPGLPLRSRQGQPSPLCALLDEVGRVLQPGPTPSAGFHQARRFGAAAMLRRPFGGPPLLALAWHRGFGAFGLVYCAIFRTSFDLALLTWTLEHPFVHELEGRRLSPRMPRTTAVQRRGALPGCAEVCELPAEAWTSHVAGGHVPDQPHHQPYPRGPA